MNVAKIIPATPCKLRNGSWGAKVTRSVREGDTLSITTRGGKSWMASVAKVVWSGSGVAIVATQSLDRPSYGDDHSAYCGYPCPVSGRRCCPKNGPCHDCE